MTEEIPEKQKQDETVHMGASPTCPKCGLEVPASLGRCPADGTTVMSESSGIQTQLTDFKFVRLIGTGGMGAVYEAINPQLNRKVAIKVMHSHLMSEVAIRRFQQEGRALSQLSHPNLLAVYDLKVTADGQPYMVLEYVAGSSLSEVLAAKGRMPVDRTLKLFLQVCDALEHAHSKGVYHRDLKPSNILITVDESGQESMKIVDFGIAKLVQVDQMETPKLTQTGEVVGSPYYMSPEQCQGRTTDYRSDIYSLGCVLFEALTGRPPFVAESAVATLMQHISDSPPPIDQVIRTGFCPPSLTRAINKALAKSPADRYQSVGELKHDIVSALRELDVPEVEKRKLLKAQHEAPGSRREPPGSQGESTKAAARRGTWILAFAGLIGLLMLSAVLYFRNQSSEPRLTDFDKKLAQSVKSEPNRSEWDLTGMGVSDQGLKVLVGLPSLHRLSLRSTRISDEGLKVVGQISTLRLLNLNRTLVTNQGISYLTGLRNLEILDLGRTKITSDVVVSLNQFPKLNELYMRLCNFNDSGLQRLEPLSIEDMDLSSTKITDEGLAGMKVMPNLVSLKISTRDISDDSLKALSKQTSLRLLSLKNTAVAGTGIKYLASLGNLESLSLPGSFINDAGLVEVAKLEGLRFLDLSDTHVTDKGMAALAESKSIAILSLKKTKITDAGLAHLSRLRTLTRIDLGGAKAITAEGVRKLKSTNPKLEIDLARADPG